MSNSEVLSLNRTTLDLRVEELEPRTEMSGMSVLNQLLGQVAGGQAAQSGRVFCPNLVHDCTTYQIPMCHPIAIDCGNYVPCNACNLMTLPFVEDIYIYLQNMMSRISGAR